MARHFASLLNKRTQPTKPQINARTNLAKLTEPGRYRAAPNLYLHVRPGGSQQWVVRLSWNKKRYDISIGPARLYSHTEAREITLALCRAAYEGRDPRIELRRTDERCLTFEEAAKRVHEHVSPTLTNDHYRRSWLSSLERHIFPTLGSMHMDKIETRHVLEVIDQIWLQKPETARKVLQRVKTIFEWGLAHGYTDRDPMAGVNQALVKQKKETKHHPALPWRDLPHFMAQLANRPALSARCLEFIILTAARSNEARGARWSEIDFDAKLWTVPANRMKARKTHTVPLADSAISLLQSLKNETNAPVPEDLIFPAPAGAKPLSDNSFAALYKRMGYHDLTTHGFRSTFRDWVNEATEFRRELAEMALAHNVGNEVERAYSRSKMIDARRPMMQAWSVFAFSR